MEHIKINTLVPNPPFVDFLKQPDENTNKQLDDVNNLNHISTVLDQLNKKADTSMALGCLTARGVLDLLEKEKLRQEAEKQRELERRKRLSRKIQPRREILTYDEFLNVLDGVSDFYKNRKCVIQRVRLALVLLYLTGLRVSNLLLITKKQYQDFYKSGSMILPLIKRGNRNHSINIPMQQAKLLTYVKNEGKALCLDKEADDLLFTSSVETDKKKQLCRVTFNKEINGYLKHVSAQLKKNIRSHSFRITYVTDLLEHGVPIHDVCDLVGHKSISTTYLYKGSHLTKAKQLSILEKRFKELP